MDILFFFQDIRKKLDIMNKFSIICLQRYASIRYCKFKLNNLTYSVQINKNRADSGEFL